MKTVALICILVLLAVSSEAQNDGDHHYKHKHKYETTCGLVKLVKTGCFTKCPYGQVHIVQLEGCPTGTICCTK